MVRDDVSPHRLPSADVHLTHMLHPRHPQRVSHALPSLFHHPPSLSSSFFTRLWPIPVDQSLFRGGRPVRLLLLRMKRNQPSFAREEGSAKKEVPEDVGHDLGVFVINQDLGRLHSVVAVVTLSHILAIKATNPLSQFLDPRE